MKKTLFLLIFLVAILLLPAVTFAAVDSIQSLVVAIVDVVWVVFTGIAIVCFVVAGVLFLTAQGQPDKVATARAAFLWGVVGVAVGIFAYSATTFIGNMLK